MIEHGLGIFKRMGGVGYIPSVERTRPQIGYNGPNCVPSSQNALKSFPWPDISQQNLPTCHPSISQRSLRSSSTSDDAFLAFRLPRLKRVIFLALSLEFHHFQRAELWRSVGETQILALDLLRPTSLHISNEGLPNTTRAEFMVAGGFIDVTPVLQLIVTPSAFSFHHFVPSGSGLASPPPVELRTQLVADWQNLPSRTSAWWENGFNL